MSNRTAADHPAAAPHTDSVTRLAWRRAVERSRLPNGVKLTALKYSEAGRHQYHDDAANIHGMTRERLAEARGIADRNVRKHLRILEATGWLVLHRQGHRGQQQNHHYVTPSSSWICWDCDPPYRKGDAKGDAKRDASARERGTGTTPFLDPGKGDGPESPSTSYLAPAPADPPQSADGSKTASNEEEDSGMPERDNEHQGQGFTGFTASARTPAEIERRSKWEVCPACENCYGSFAHKVACKVAS